MSQLDRLGTYATKYNKETGQPIEFVALPPKSYAEKLLSAYKILGGIPEQDFLLRDRNDPVHLTRGTPIRETGTEFVGGFSDEYSNNRRYRGGMRFDRDLGLLVTRFKNYQMEAIKRKRENLEYKIKRVMDCSDQMMEEIIGIDVILGEGRYSFNQLVARIEASIADPDNLNTIQGDRFGLNIGREADLTREDQILEQRAQGQRGGVGV